MGLPSYHTFHTGLPLFPLHEGTLSGQLLSHCPLLCQSWESIMCSLNICWMSECSLAWVFLLCAPGLEKQRMMCPCVVSACFGCYFHWNQRPHVFMAVNETWKDKGKFLPGALSRMKYGGVDSIILPKIRSNLQRGGTLVKEESSHWNLKTWFYFQSSWKGVIYLQENFPWDILSTAKAHSDIIFTLMLRCFSALFALENYIYSLCIMLVIVDPLT